MARVSLLHIETRSTSSLLGTGKQVRLSYFNTPSSFYVQLVEEDERYACLEREMQRFYEVYSSNTDDLRPNVQRTKKLKIRKLLPRSYIAIKYNDVWHRCVTTTEATICRLLDTGLYLTLEQKIQDEGIYELELRFCSLAPRAILCGLGSILPVRGHKWSIRACRLFTEAVRDRRLIARFLMRGLGFNTYYVVLTSVDSHNNKLHVHMALCAYDVAALDYAKLHHPIWPRDTPI